ncbi:MAG: leucine-rich repeat protein [Oscillospiraceae bacterium]|nr:leucine-rich repeat protein [Oscillospiraceae bacterium]
MKRKLFSATILLLLSLCLVLTAGAQETEPVKSGQFGDNVTWNLYADGTLVFSGTGATEDSVDYIVEGWHSHLADVKHVVFEEGITYIGAYIFYNNRSSIYDTIETITIPSTVEHIGELAFTGLPGLKGVYISDLEAWCEIEFEDTDANPLCNNVDLYLNGEPITDLVIPGSIRKVKPYAFYGSAGIHTVTVHSNVTEIGSFSFNSASCLKHMIFQGSAPAFGEHVFTLSELTAYYPDGAWGWDSAIQGDYGGNVTWVSYTGDAPEITDEPCSRIFWDFDEATQTLTLSGYGHTGDFVAYHADYPRPEWDLCMNNALHLVVEEGITGLGDFAFFRYQNLVSVSLPSTLKSIGRGTFQNCIGITEIQLPDGLTEMGMYAFQETGLRSITIPTSLTVIPAQAFLRCSYLTEVNFHDGVTEIQTDAFRDCVSMESVTLPAGLEVLGNDVFPSYIMGTMKFPATLRVYGDRAMLGLTEIIFTGPAPTFGSEAFQSQTATVYYPENDPTWTEAIMQPYGGRIIWICGDGPSGEPDPGNIEWEFDIHANALTITGTGPMPDYPDLPPWVRYTDRMGSVTIGEGITHIGAYAFADCFVLSQVSLPSTLESIGDYAFSGCTSLTELHLPEGVTRLGSGCFASADCLRALYFTGDAPVFAEDTFAGLTATCYYSEDKMGWTADVLLNYGGNITWKTIDSLKDSGAYGTHGTWTFDPTTGTLTISTDGLGPLPMDNPSSWGWSCPWESYRPMVKTVVFTEGVTSTGVATLWNHTALTAVSFPSTLTAIDDSCFSGCTSLKEIALPEGLLHIGVSAFNSSGLTRVEIPDTVTNIWESAFRNCDSLVSIRLPSGLQSADNYAFAGCGILTEIIIPELPSLKGLGFHLFADCDALTNIDFWNLPVITGYTFSGCDGLVDLYIPEGVTHLVFEGAAFSTSFAFSQCSNLKTVIIPASVEKIGELPFADCFALEAIYFLGDAPEMDSSALASNPAKVYYPENNPTWTEELRSQHDVEWVPFDGIVEKPDSNPFTDVAKQDYFYTPVLWAVENGITSGMSATTFAPNATCTRAQVVTFLWRAMGKPAPGQHDNPFTDVKQGDYFYDAVLWAVEKGITAGTSATTFAPNNPCTRDQVVTFLWRAMGQPAPGTQDNPFTDVPEAQWYYQPVLWAVENGITSGTSATTFAPGSPCTRGQVVTFLYRAFAK